MGCHFLLQEIFLTQGSNDCLLHCQAKNSVPMSHQGSRIRASAINNYKYCLLFQVLCWTQQERVNSGLGRSNPARSQEKSVFRTGPWPVPRKWAWSPWNESSAWQRCSCRPVVLDLLRQLCQQCFFALWLEFKQLRSVTKGHHACVLSRLVVSNSLRPQAPLSMGIFPGKNTGVGCHDFPIMPVTDPNKSSGHQDSGEFHWLAIACMCYHTSWWGKANMSMWRYWPDTWELVLVSLGLCPVSLGPLLILICILLLE